MTKNIVSVPPSATALTVASVMEENGTGFVPVCDNDVLLGVITDRDIVLRCTARGLSPEQATAALLMTEKPVFISPEHSVTEAARLMAREGVRRLPVCESNRMIGVISLGDISRSRSFFSETAAAFCDISMPRNP